MCPVGGKKPSGAAKVGFLAKEVIIMLLLIILSHFLNFFKSIYTLISASLCSLSLFSFCRNFIRTEVHFIYPLGLRTCLFLALFENNCVSLHMN